MSNIDKIKNNQNNDFGLNIDSNIYKDNNGLEIRGDIDDSFSDVNMEDILDVMGCKTRRDIISLLKEEPKFVSEISTELNVGQKAIIEHLRAMEAIGMLQSSYKKIVRGRPRKYYDMPHDVNINISITKNSFSINISEGLIDKLQLPSGDEWSKLLELEKRIDNGHWEAIEDLKSHIRLYDNLKERAEYILERTNKEK